MALQTDSALVLVSAYRVLRVAVRSDGMVLASVGVLQAAAESWFTVVWRSSSIRGYVVGKTLDLGSMDCNVLLCLKERLSEGVEIGGFIDL